MAPKEFCQAQGRIGEIGSSELEYILQCMIFDERQTRFLYKEGIKSIYDVLQIEIQELEKLIWTENDALEDHEVEALRYFRFWHS